MLGVLSPYSTKYKLLLIFTILMALSSVAEWGARVPGEALYEVFIDCQERYDNPNFTSWLLLISIFRHQMLSKIWISFSDMLS